VVSPGTLPGLFFAAAQRWRAADSAPQRAASSAWRGRRPCSGPCGGAGRRRPEQRDSGQPQSTSTGNGMTLRPSGWQRQRQWGANAKGRGHGSAPAHRPVGAAGYPPNPYGGPNPAAPTPPLACAPAAAPSHRCGNHRGVPASDQRHGLAPGVPTEEQAALVPTTISAPTGIRTRSACRHGVRWRWAMAPIAYADCNAIRYADKRGNVLASLLVWLAKIGW
jgi:hypothetical protein